ncbi:hypothetical protein [Mycobacterium marinum]|nr:hypothetical protein [Mycobacterium marinum]EPQ74605.1 hypothetical protein MMEU_2265 [Mycobacterium marinum str. Europe]
MFANAFDTPDLAALLLPGGLIAAAMLILIFIRIRYGAIPPSLGLSSKQVALFMGVCTVVFIGLGCVGIAALVSEPATPQTVLVTLFFFGIATASLIYARQELHRTTAAPDPRDG